jgi:hypothetical protein
MVMSSVSLKTQLFSALPSELVINFWFSPFAIYVWLCLESYRQTDVDPFLPELSSSTALRQLLQDTRQLSSTVR